MVRGLQARQPPAAASSAHSIPTVLCNRRIGNGVDSLLDHAYNADYDACIADMTPPLYLGEFEYAVLLAILHARDDAYAVPVRSLIEERTGRSVARGALYTALERLEAKGCLRSATRNPSPERGGRARRYFTVTPRGLQAMRATHAALRNLTAGLETVLEQS